MNISELYKDAKQHLEKQKLRKKHYDCFYRKYYTEENLTKEEFSKFCVYAMAFFRPQSYAARIERLIRCIYGMKKVGAKEKCGDAFKQGKYYEIKICDTTENGRYIVRQVRSHHTKINYYISIGINLNNSSFKIFIFPENIMVSLAKKYGSPTHGNKKTENKDVEWSWSFSPDEIIDGIKIKDYEITWEQFNNRN